MRIKAVFLRSYASAQFTKINELASEFLYSLKTHFENSATNIMNKLNIQL